MGGWVLVAFRPPALSCTPTAGAPAPALWPWHPQAIGSGTHARQAAPTCIGLQEDLALLPLLLKPLVCVEQLRFEGRRRRRPLLPLLCCRRRLGRCFGFGLLRVHRRLLLLLLGLLGGRRL